MPKEISISNKLRLIHSFIQNSKPSPIYMSITEPLDKHKKFISEQLKYTKDQQIYQKLFKKSSNVSNQKQESDKSNLVINNKTDKNLKKTKPIAFQSLRQSLYFKQLWTDYQTTEKNKVIINSNLSQEMRKRNVISQMKHYKISTKNEKQEEKSQIKKEKKRKSTDAIKILRKEQKSIIEIIPNHTAVSQPRKKQGKPVKKLSQQASTFSSRQPKLQFKSIQLHRQRKCKSSLREENINMINTLKQIGKTLPIPSKLNSLYSNTTSIYNSYSDIQTIQRKIAQRIPTQESSQQIEQIRQYQSLALSRDKSVRSLRTTSKKIMIQQLPPTIIQIQPQKTENIINNYLQKIKIQSEFQIVQPRSIEEVQQIFNDTSLNGLISKQASIENSLIEQLQSSNNQLNNSKIQLQKLNEIVSIIQKSRNDQIAEKKDKQYILQTIKSILSNKKHQSINQQVKVIDKYQLNEAKTKIFLNTSSLNTSSFHESISSENVSQINLQILDKALRQREIYLNARLKKQLQKIEERKNEGLSEKFIQEEIDRTTKWITHQIKEVHHTRTQLWKGFNVAKNLLRDEVGDKNREMMKCLSEKYINTWNMFSKSKSKKESKDNKQIKHFEPQQNKKFQSQQRQLDDGFIEEIQPRIVGDSNSDYQDSDKKISALKILQQDIKFLSSNSSYIDQEQQHKDLSQKDFSYIQDIISPEKRRSQDEKDYSSPPSNISKLLQFQSSDALQLKLKKIEEFEERTIQKALQRERLDCQTPQSDSQNQSYGAVIIERQDTFLFSSDKKSQSSIIDLTIQDKEDICQFIFLDLCIEMTEENPIESKVIKQLLNFIKKAKQQSTRSKGFKTNTIAIKQYLTNFIAFLKTKPEIVAQIHYNIEKPMGPTALQILRYMHSYNDEAQEENEPFVLTAKVFDIFEDNYMKTLKIQRFYDDQEKEARRRNFLKNAIHIHNKAIYDAYNQTLDKHRPFGIWGQPFSWKKVPKFHHDRAIKQKNNIIVKSAQQTIEYSNFMCGFIPDKQGSSIKDNPQISQAYIEQVRYDRLSQMMAKQLSEAQERMCFFDDQQTQILVDLAQFIFNWILQEAVRQYLTLR